jgi:hypothetical protein
MANRHRGEIPLQIGGRRLGLRLTLGGLAELEDAMDAGDLAGLAERFSAGRLRARDVIGLLRIGLDGAGHQLSDADIAALGLDHGLVPVIEAIAAMLVTTFGDQGEAGAAPAQASGEAATEPCPNP